MRKLNRTTIKPVLKYIDGWDSDIHSLNTPGADFYEFTLDVYNGKNSWQGGFSWGLDGCYSNKYDNNFEIVSSKPNEAYAIDLKSNRVYDLTTRKVIFTA